MNRLFVFTSLSLAFFLYQGLSSASDLKNEMNCRIDGNDAYIFKGHSPDKKVKILGRSDICDGGYQWLRDPVKIGIGFIIAAPLDLGLQAKSMVFRVSLLSGTALKIGEIPASAEKGSGFKFNHIFQESGSSFLDRYELSNTKVHYLGTKLELVFDGNVCIAKNGLVSRSQSIVDNNCENVIEASFKNPVCLSYHENHTHVVRLKKCSVIIPPQY